MPLPFFVPALVAFTPPAMPPLIAVHPTQKAIDLLNAGRVPEALEQLELAITRDPKDAQPLWIKAQVYRELAKQAKGWAAAWYRESAEEAAEALLELPDLDRNAAGNAMSLLQNLRDDERPMAPGPTPAALKAFEAGEAAFGREAWEEARADYAQALKESPTFAKAALCLGDAYFAEGRMPEAVRWFRKAADLDPGDPRAWRYMADAQMKAGQLKEAEATMMAAIRVFPANRASWRPLVQFRQAQGRPMARLRFRPGVTVGWKSDGTQILGVDPAPADDHAQTVWMILAGAVLDTIHVDTRGEGPALRTRFQQERFFWDLALTTYAEACRNAKVEPRDRILCQFLSFQKDGQLDAALFLLRYREAFRPDYEAWQKAHPGGVEAFLERYNLRP